MKYFAQFLNDGKARVVIRVKDDIFCYRFDWISKTWVYDPAIFLKMQGVGGDGHDWEEITEKESEELIKTRIYSLLQG